MCDPSGSSEEIPSASAREQLRDLKGHAEVSNSMQTWIVLEVESDFTGGRGSSGLLPESRSKVLAMSRPAS